MAWESLSSREFRRWEKQRRLDNLAYQRQLGREVNKRVRDNERSKYEQRWPYVVSAVFFALGFVPGLGWVTVAGFLFLPPFWAVCLVITDHRGRPYFLAMLFAVVNAAVALVAQIYYLLHM